MGQRRFLPFFITQCLGALNDNVFRYGLIFLVTRKLLAVGDLDSAVVVNLSAALFILPFFLFSAMAGQLADKLDKALLIRRIKAFELVLMSVAAFGLLSNSAGLLLAVLFMTGVQSALFGPVKYSILPEVLSNEELIGGNALVEGATYVAIIVGMVLGGWAVTAAPGEHALAIGLVAIALVGLIAALFVPATRAAAPGLGVNFNPVPETIAILRMARAERSVFLSILGISWFWGFGLVAMSQLPGYAAGILRIDDASGIAVVLPATFAIGVGLGSLLCERLSGRQVELGLVPLGALGLTLFAVDLYLAAPAPVALPVYTLGDLLIRPQLMRVVFDLTMIGVAGGIFSVPLYSMMQQRSPRAERSRIIAANNVLNSLVMTVAAMAATLFALAGLTIPEMFLVLALMNSAVAAYLFTLLPEFVLRFLTWMLIRTLYRVRTSGLEFVPREGPAVLVCNHVSFVDALLIGGSVRRPARFVMYYKIFEIPLLSLLFKTARAIPIAGRREDEAMLERAFESIDAELAAGQVVCLFPEGAITRDGAIAPFRPGIERILAARPVPVVPMALRGLWGSWFSRKDGGALRKWPRRLRARIELVAGAPVQPEHATAELLERRVRELRGADR